MRIGASLSQHARGVVGARPSRCRSTGHGTVAWQVNGERTRPHCIMVNRRGRRFTNEAANYNALGDAFHVVDVSTLRVRQPPGVDGLRPLLPRPSTGWPATPDGTDARTGSSRRRRWRRWPTRSGCHRRRWRTRSRGGTTSADGGDDPDFGRGRSAHDRWWGDPDFGDDVRATLGPIDSPPYYAVEVHSGALGTKGGPRTDGDARVARRRRHADRRARTPPAT